MASDGNPPKILVQYSRTILIAVVLGLIGRFFVIASYRVNSGSMEDTLLTGDLVLVDKISFDFGRQINRGDIIVFNGKKTGNRDFLKRVVGIPSDTIFLDQKKVYVNGQIDFFISLTKNIDSLIIPGDSSLRDYFRPIIVPPNMYFVMGDNRDNSLDSRFFGCIPSEAVVGRVFCIYYINSWSDFGFYRNRILR